MIFCVEDDPNIRELEVYTLKSTGFPALGLESGDELFKALETVLPQLIILDIMLPGEDGMAILKRLHCGHPCYHGYCQRFGVRQSTRA